MDFLGKFLIIEIGGSEEYLKNGSYFIRKDSIVIEELLQKIIEIEKRIKNYGTKIILKQFWGA